MKPIIGFAIGFWGVDPSTVKIDQHHNIDRWQTFITDTMRELTRITRPGGYIACEVGEVRKGRIHLEDNVIAATEGLPLQMLGVMINQQELPRHPIAGALRITRGALIATGLCY